VQNLSNEKEFDLHENKMLGRTHFHINSFPQTHFDTEAKRNLEVAK